MEREIAEKERALQQEMQRLREQQERNLANMREQANRFRREAIRADRRATEQGANTDGRWSDPRNIPSPQYGMPRVPQQAATPARRVVLQQERRWIRATYTPRPVVLLAQNGVVPPNPTANIGPSVGPTAMDDFRQPREASWVAGERVSAADLDARQQGLRALQGRVEAARVDAARQGGQSWAPASINCGATGAGPSQSDITGGNLIPNASSGHVTARAAPQQWPCASTAGWSREQPYNHGEPVTITPVFGRPVTLRRNQVLVSVANPRVPGGRVLAAQDWNALEHVLSATGNCASFESAPNRPSFAVDLNCEMGRQQVLWDNREEQLRPFERREDGYMDWDECKIPVDERADAATRTIRDWMDDGEPVARCNDNRRDERRGPVRDRGWRTTSYCEARGFATSVNSRGVRGCKDPAPGNELAPPAFDGLTPDTEGFRRSLNLD